MTEYRAKRSYYYLALLAHLGPMTGKELWSCLFENVKREETFRVFQFYPRDPWDDLALLRKYGKVYIHSRNPNNREIIWAASN